MTNYWDSMQDDFVERTLLVQIVCDVTASLKGQCP
jgi:hypothetical protein